MPLANAANDEKPRLVVGLRGRSRQRLVLPKRLRLDEINPVLGLIGRAFLRIEFVGDERI
jgi:hypothetical protein